MSGTDEGKAIRHNIERVAPEVVEAARHYVSSILADVAGRRRVAWMAASAP
jgi:hypothetical protein